MDMYARVPLANMRGHTREPRSPFSPRRGVHTSAFYRPASISASAPITATAAADRAPIIIPRLRTRRIRAER
jgi:hypothetical protein